MFNSTGKKETCLERLPRGEGGGEGAHREKFVGEVANGGGTEW
jgi:hypothetical protein